MAKSGTINSIDAKTPNVTKEVKQDAELLALAVAEAVVGDANQDETLVRVVPDGRVAVPVEGDVVRHSSSLERH